MVPKRGTRNVVKQKELDKRKKLDELGEEKKKWKKVKLKAKKAPSKKAREERLKKKREAEKMRRQRIKADPVEYEDYLRDASKRYQVRVSEGKKKLRSDCTEREVRLLRQKDREQARLRHLKKENDVLEDLTAGSSKNRCEKENSDTDSVSTDSKRKCNENGAHRKKVNKRQKICYNENRKLRMENGILKTSLETNRKRVTRFKNKSKVSNNLPNISSPKSQVEKFLSTNPSSESIRQELILGKTLCTGIKERYENTNKNEEKQYLAHLANGDFTNKYHLVAKVRQDVVPLQASRIDDEAGSMQFERKQRITSEMIKMNVEEFYLENSKINPGKGEYVRIGQEKVQKRVLDASMIDLHAKFLNESQLSIVYSTFAKYRPLPCVEPNITDRDTCACFLCENSSLLVTAMYDEKILEQNSPEKILLCLLCAHRTDECFSRTCTDCKSNDVHLSLDHKTNEDEIVYLKWTSRRKDRISAKTNDNITVQVTVKCPISCKAIEIEDLFKEELKIYVSHKWRVFHQYSYWKGLKRSITEHDFLLNIDFSENWLQEFCTEVQRMHFEASRQQFTLHTGMLYSKSLTQGFVTLSESLRHDAIAIMTHLKSVLDFYLAQLPDVKNLFLLSDGPSTQYRNRFMVSLITQYLPGAYPQIQTIDYNFSEAGHGKGPSDGIGSASKRAADDAVKYGTDITNLDTLVSAVKKGTKEIHVSSVTSEDISSFESAVDMSSAKACHGISKYHQYTWNRQDPTKVQLNSLSCLACTSEIRCDHFSIRNLDYVESKKKKSSDKCAGKSRKKIKTNVQKNVRKKRSINTSDINESASDSEEEYCDNVDGQSSKKMRMENQTTVAAQPTINQLRRTSKRVSTPNSRFKDYSLPRKDGEFELKLS